jgi:hypothetical protein
MARDDAAEARADREAETEREQQVEARRERAMTLAVQQAEARGQVVNPMAIATGRGLPGRTIPAIFAAAAEAGNREDEIAAARANREPGEKVHVYVDEPQIHHPRSVTGLAMFNRSRRFFAARKAAAKAEAAAQSSKNDWGLLDIDINDRTGFR